jgi:hypothetical protein
MLVSRFGKRAGTRAEVLARWEDKNPEWHLRCLDAMDGDPPCAFLWRFATTWRRRTTPSKIV